MSLIQFQGCGPYRCHCSQRRVANEGWIYGNAEVPQVSKPRDSGLNFSNRSVKFDMYLDNSDAEMPVKFQSDTIIITRTQSRGFETSPRALFSSKDVQ